MGKRRIEAAAQSKDPLSAWPKHRRSKAFSRCNETGNSLTRQRHDLAPLGSFDYVAVRQAHGNFTQDDRYDSRILLHLGEDNDQGVERQRFD